MHLGAILLFNCVFKSFILHVCVLLIIINSKKFNKIKKKVFK